MDDDRMTAIRKYLAENPSVQDTPGGVHIHFHNGPVIQDPRPVDQNPGMKVLEKFTPYLVIGAMCCVPVAGVALVVVLLVPAILALTVMVVGAFLALSVCIIAVKGLTREMNDRPTKGKRK